MTSLTAPTTSSSPHFCFQCSTNCFNFPSIVVCVIVCHLRRGVVVCVNICIVNCIVIFVIIIGIVAHSLHRGVVVCIMVFLSVPWRCCCGAARHLHHGIVVCIAALLSALQHRCQHCGVILCVVVRCLRCDVVVCGCIVRCLHHGVIVCVDGTDNNDAHHCHSHNYCH
jgi:hypothetical protein